MDVWIRNLLLGSSLLTLTQFAHALELRYSNGDFQMGAAVKPLVNMDVALDVDTWTLAEPHKTFGNSRFYYQFRADYFDSDSVNRMTDLASLPLTTNLPVIGSSVSDLIADNTPLPVPADYRIHGVNVDAGIGYDVIKQAKGHVGIGLNTGVSTPYMKVRNMQSSANLFLNLLDTFDTEVVTYKAGISLQGSYQVTPWLEIGANASLNHQTGEMDNGWVGSDVDMDGTYRTLDIGVKLKPAPLLQQAHLKKAFVSVGYSRSRWDYDNAQINTPMGSVQVPGMFDADFEHDMTYVGLGYDF